MRIVIETIPISDMRYATCGDYWYDDLGTLQVRVAETGVEVYNKMIMVHELLEEALTKHRGLLEPQITEFDLYYEERKRLKLVSEESEPGFDNNCPYRNEHALATATEMSMCALAGISWSDYDNTINNLQNG